jgi:hypothetical protein
MHSFYLRYAQELIWTCEILTHPRCPVTTHLKEKHNYSRGGWLSQKKRVFFKMWIEHGPQSLLGLWLAPRGRPCSEFLFAPELEYSNLRGPCLIVRGVDPTFHHKIFTADHPLHQMAHFVWYGVVVINKYDCKKNQVKRWSAWLNMCCFPIERHQIRVWAVKVSFDPRQFAHCDLHGYKHNLVQLTISAFI